MSKVKKTEKIYITKNILLILYSYFYRVSESAIYRCCVDRRNYAGIDEESGEKLAWSYID